MHRIAINTHLSTSTHICYCNDISPMVQIARIDPVLFEEMGANISDVLMTVMEPVLRVVMECM